MARAAVDLSVVRGVGTWEVVPGRAGTYRPVIASAKLREGAPGSRLVFHAHLPHWRGARRRQRRTRSIAHGKNRIPYRIDRRLTCLAGPHYDATISFGLSFEPEDSQYGKSRLRTVTRGVSCSRGRFSVPTAALVRTRTLLGPHRRSRSHRHQSRRKPSWPPIAKCNSASPPAWVSCWRRRDDGSCLAAAGGLEQGDLPSVGRFSANKKIRTHRVEEDSPQKRRIPRI